MIKSDPKVSMMDPMPTSPIKSTKPKKLGPATMGKAKIKAHRATGAGG